MLSEGHEKGHSNFGSVLLCSSELALSNWLGGLVYRFGTL